MASLSFPSLMKVSSFFIRVLSLLRRGKFRSRLLMFWIMRFFADLIIGMEYNWLFFD